MSAAKDTKNGNIPADLQPYFDAPRTTTRSWARWIIRILALVIIICLLIIFVKWTWHQTHKSSGKKSQPDTSQQSSTQSSGSNSPINLGGSSEGDTSSSQSNTQSTDQNTATQNSNVNSNLTNTGPGQTIAVFVAATVFFALAYQLRLRKQA